MVTSQLNRTTNLCLACSSSLPPRAQSVFLTPCCARPICPACLSSNPRLGRYNPCLSCLGGTAVVSASSSSRHLSPGLATSEKNVINVDGALRDDDMFVLGDDDEEDDHKVEHKPSGNTESSNIKASQLGVTSEPIPNHASHSQAQTEPGPPSEQTSFRYEAVPPLYYLERGDTLQGIALRLNVNGHELCRLNNLPMSTLTTTPHLLHTRTSIRLPPSARLQPRSAPAPVDSEAKARAARERAEKRLQVVTKESDWRVAKAYVALADDPEADVLFDAKCKELGTDVIGTGLEARALDMYLEDEEWEKGQRRVGAAPTTNRKVYAIPCYSHLASPKVTR